MRRALSYLFAIVDTLGKSGFTSLIYKPVPAYYFEYPTYEDEYGLFLLKAELCQRKMSFVISLARPLPVAEFRLRHYRRAERERVTLEESKVFAPFWNEILIPNLQRKYGTAPVHSVDEIQDLAESFPNHITLYQARCHGRLIAGTVIYQDKGVAHTQYISTNDEGRRVGALDFIFLQLLRTAFRSFRYFSFGTAHEDGEGSLSYGLVKWKESFGARAFPHNVYRVELGSRREGAVTGPWPNIGESAADRGAAVVDATPAIRI